MYMRIGRVTVMQSVKPLNCLLTTKLVVNTSCDLNNDVQHKYKLGIKKKRPCSRFSNVKTLQQMLLSNPWQHQGSAA